MGRPVEVAGTSTAWSGPRAKSGRLTTGSLAVTSNVVVYTPPQEAGKLWDRHVLDDSLNEGHAVVTADFDGDGADEIVAGWRAGGGGLAYYDALDASGRKWKKRSPRKQNRCCSDRKRKRKNLFRQNR